jgi:plasmid maintenance system antidote protein VapI
MAEIIIDYIPIQTLGYVVSSVPEDIMSIVRAEINEMIENNFEASESYNYRLAGALEKEFALKKSVDKLNLFFRKVIPEYWRLCGDYLEAEKSYQLQIRDDKKNSDLWVNLQKKYEVNPIHNHSGILSFVLYVDIPYDLETERQQLHTIHSNSKYVPSFNFLYPNMYPGRPNLHAGYKPVKFHTLEIDKTWENKMIIFPAWLQHTVSPFYTSDEYRISVSGNLVGVCNG